MQKSICVKYIFFNGNTMKMCFGDLKKAPWISHTVFYLELSKPLKYEYILFNVSINSTHLGHFCTIF